MGGSVCLPVGPQSVVDIHVGHFLSEETKFKTQFGDK
jgi:hypothetical protein